MDDAQAAQAALDGQGGGEDPPGGESAQQPPGEREQAETKGVYMVLWAPRPEDDDEPLYREVGYYEAHGWDNAKRRALADKGNPRATELRGAMKAGQVYLRAVPARSWPAEIEASGYERPEPRLQVR